MQKKLLSLLIVASCSVMHPNGIKWLSDDDLAKPVGELGAYVKDSSQAELDAREEEARRKLRVCERLANERRIHDYQNDNIISYQNQLALELSGQQSAIKEEYDKNGKNNEIDAQNEKKKQSDASPGFWSYPPTENSVHGRANLTIEEVQEKKNKINQYNSDLVTKNKDDVFSTLVRQLDHQYYVFATVYLKELRACHEKCGNDKNCFIKCLLQKDNKGNWQDIENPIFFKRFANDAYEATAGYAKSKKIDLSVDDVENSARKNKQTVDLVGKINVAEK